MAPIVVSAAAVLAFMVAGAAVAVPGVGNVRAEPAVARPPEVAPAEVPPHPETPDRVLRRAQQLALSRQKEAAIRLLETWTEKEGDNPKVIRRLASLYRDTQNWDKLATLVQEQLKKGATGDETALRRLLAEAQFERGQRDEAIAGLRAILKVHPTEPSYARMVASTLSRHGENAAAIEILLEARRRENDPHSFAQQLGALYEKEGQPVEATRQFLLVIIKTPMNLSLMRTRILELYPKHPPQASAVMTEVEKAAAGYPAVPQLKVLLGEMRQLSGDEERAWEIISPLLANPSVLADLLQTAQAGISESRLPGADPVISRRSLRLSQKILEGLLQGNRLPKSLQARAYDALNRSWLALLENPTFEELPLKQQEEALSGAKATILEMARRFPHDQQITASLLRLARAYVDLLHQPEDAIKLYRRIQVDPNASEVEIHTARAGLGRAFMAAGDTTRARRLFEQMGSDMSFVEGQGRAHYHLGQLDFMGGRFEQAKDRLSVVAFESPSADYTNDALDLALLLSEELMGDNDEASLSHYGRALFFRIAAREDSLLLELEKVTRGNSPVLRARARYELAVDDFDHHRDKDASRQISRFLKEDSESRQLPAVLELQGDLFLREGREEAALASYDRLLMNHEDYIFLNRVRDKIRALRPEGSHRKGELP